MTHTNGSYNERLQPTSMWDMFYDIGDTFVYAANPITWDTASGGHNNNGNLRSALEFSGGPGNIGTLFSHRPSYDYDALNRLKTVTDYNFDQSAQYYQQTFSYDAYGNRAVSGNTPSGMTPTDLSWFTGGTNRLAGGSYDAAGNQTVFGTYAVTYDAENRQTKVTAGTASTQYVYDGLGQRVERVLADQSQVVYVYDALGQLAAEYRSGAAVSSPCGTCYLTRDHLGSVRVVTNEAQQVVSLHDYLAFGEEIAGMFGRTGQFGQNDGVSQRFTGQVRDGDTVPNLDYFGARYYGSALGRFTSPDPMNAGADMTDPQSWNGYAYVGNSPLNRVDPTGASWLGNLWNSISGWFGGSNGSSYCESFSSGDCGMNSDQSGQSGSGSGSVITFLAIGTGVADRNPQPVSTPPNTGTVSGLASCAASNASSFASLLGLPKDNFWAQAFLGNDFSTAANLLLGNDRGTNGRGALLSNPTPINATSIALSAIGKKVVATGGLVVKETPGGAPYAATKFLPIAETVGGKLLFKGIAAFSAVKLVYDGAAFGYAELQCGGIVQ